MCVLYYRLLLGYRCARYLSVSLSVSLSACLSVTLLSSAAHAVCALSFGAAFAILLWPLVLSAVNRFKDLYRDGIGSHFNNM